MLDIGEFHKIRKKVFVNKEKIHTLSDLQEYYLDLEIVCFNERSMELIDLLKYIIGIAEQQKDDGILFKLYWLFFSQTYYFMKEMKKTEEIFACMKEIASKSKDIEQLTIMLRAESLLCQIKGKHDQSLNSITQALEMISDFKEEFPETFFGTLYEYTIFTSFIDGNYTEVISNLTECLSFYHKRSSNSLGMVYVINLLQRFYLLSNQEEKVNELIHWVFQEEEIQSKIIDKHYISLNWYAGTIATKRYMLQEAIQYLHDAHSKIVKNDNKFESMYEYTDIVRLLSRCYALRGEFQKSFDLLIELLDFMETDSVKDNYFQKGIKWIYFSSYNTLLFIFAQLDLDSSILEDSKIKQIYDHIKTILDKAPLSKTLLLESSFDEKDLKLILETEKKGAEVEFNSLLHQLLTTQKPYDVTEDTVMKIQTIKEYAYEPLYFDVLLGKVYLAIGNQSEFLNIVMNMRNKNEEIKVPILQLWLEIFILLEEYISDSTDSKTVQKLVELEGKCRKNNLKKVAEEIQLYRVLISSTKTIEQSENRFSSSAFIDIFNEQSKKIVMEYFKD
jgi:hypothetical protein